MGKLEEENKKETRRTDIQETILTTILSGGRMGASNLIPQVLNALLNLDLPVSKRKNEAVKSAAINLRKKGLIKFEGGHYALTDQGKKVLGDWQMTDYKVPRPKKWDRKWRVIIFDIPEKKRAIRTGIRKILIEAGFQRLQDSVWVYPYDCEDAIALMKINLKIENYLLYMIVDRIENDRYLRMDFDLL